MTRHIEVELMPTPSFFKSKYELLLDRPCGWMVIPFEFNLINHNATQSLVVRRIKCRIVRRKMFGFQTIQDDLNVYFDDDKEFAVTRRAMLTRFLEQKSRPCLGRQGR